MVGGEWPCYLSEEIQGGFFRKHVQVVENEISPEGSIFITGSGRERPFHFVVFRFSWKWRKRSPIRIMERTHEEATEALHAGRESRHPEAASVGASSNLRIM